MNVVLCDLDFKSVLLRLQISAGRKGVAKEKKKLVNVKQNPFRTNPLLDNQLRQREFTERSNDRYDKISNKVHAINN